MKATGLVVEYNPFHNGHLYHATQAKNITNADCVIAVMSGQFLQRGEPAIVDKFYRTKMALTNGVDIVVELPFPFAVQSSHYFAMGAIDTLANLFVDSICFGSESGKVTPFIKYNLKRKENEIKYNSLVQRALNSGCSYPEANEFAFKTLDLGNEELDLTLPNNILGRSYVERIINHHPQINPLTIGRKDNHYHDETISGQIASATSIRKAIIKENQLDEDISASMPKESVHFLNEYYHITNQWHLLESYFQYLRFCVLRMSHEELESIHGVDEGLEFKLKDTVQKVHNMQDWLTLMKSKRYTWTRLQRMFVHILTNTKKHEIYKAHDDGIQYIRLLGLSNTGRYYLNQYKKQLAIPLISSIQQLQNDILTIEERASHCYYSILDPSIQRSLFIEELRGPIFTH